MRVKKATIILISNHSFLVSVLLFCIFLIIVKFNYKEKLSETVFHDQTLNRFEKLVQIYLPKPINKVKYTVNVKRIYVVNRAEWFNVSHYNWLLGTGCPELGCILTSENDNIQNFSALFFTTSNQYANEPPVSADKRNKDQAWIFFGLESPVHMHLKWFHGEQWNDMMNWSMSYRTDADIYHPYGAVQPRKTQLKRNYSDIFRQKTKLAAWAVSNCGANSQRDEYVALMKNAGLQVLKYYLTAI